MNSTPLINDKKYLIPILLGTIASAFLSVNAIAHEGHVDKDAQLACEKKVLRASCQYRKETDQNIAKVYSGYCQKISHNKICVRNQPIKTIVLEPLSN